jgi:membrane protein YqaA with SNARE-associated domain
VVPKAGLEPARLAAGDFESPASTIPPLGHLAAGLACIAQPYKSNLTQLWNWTLTQSPAHGVPMQRNHGFQMIRRLYEWTLSLAQHPHALWALAVVAFVESSFFPIPPDIIMIPMIIARPNRAFMIAGVALFASVMGGLLGYAIGALAFETLGQPILAALGKADAMAEFSGRFNDLGFWAVLTAGVTPFPYKVITIMSGWTGMPLGIFIATSILARGLRFFIVAGLLWKYGAPIRDFIERRLGLMFTLALILLLGGFAAVKFL